MPPDALVSFFDLIHDELDQRSPSWRCLFTLPDRRHYWFQNSRDLARAALGLDSRGLAVFHGCATFTEGKSGKPERKQEHVAKLRCFWFDIDAGVGRQYSSPGEVYSAFEEFRRRTSLPPAVIVVSGGGLHVYWPLRVAIAASRWQTSASILRTLAIEHGLHIDAGSTIDSARILRPPGTHNRKLLDDSGKKLSDTGGAPRPVVMGPLVGPYEIEDLEAILGVDTPPVDILANVPAYLKGVQDDAGLFNVGAGEPDSDPAMVADECAQVLRLRETRGNLPEPEWYAVLGVLAHCGAAGRDAAHRWSNGDVRYTPADTEAKLDQYLANAGGPTTCTRFASLNPGLCILCKHQGRITSPIQLGRGLTVAQAATAPARLELPPLPKPFFWYGMKLAMQRKPDEDDATNYHVISEYPIVVDQLQETERSARISAVFRSWEPMKIEWRDFSMGLGELHSNTGLSKLSDHGVVIAKNRWNKFIQYADQTSNDFRGSRHYGVRYEQFGWKSANGAGVGFVLGDKLICGDGKEYPIHGNEEVARRGALMLPRGDPRLWSAAANKLIGHKGMEAHAFMLLCSFAAPLYHFAGEPGVSFVHGATRASGKGKTTILEAGASVWGELDATSIIERDTMVAKFITLGTLCHLPVFFDELRFKDPEDTKQYVLQGSAGRDKQRGRAEGGIRTDHLSWQTIHISASNLSLSDTVRSDGSEIAQAARIFEFTLVLPDGMLTTEGDALKRQLRENRGTAGIKFIHAVLENRAWVEQAVTKRVAHYEQHMQAKPDERFVLRLFGCVDVAGALVRKAGLLHVDMDAVMSWAVSVQRGNAGRLAVDAQADAAAVLSQMINDFEPNTLRVAVSTTMGKPTATPVVGAQQRQELKARLETNTRKYLVDISAVRKWMQGRKQSFSEIQKELSELKILIEARVRRTIGAGTSMALGQVWCWQVDGNHPLLIEAIDPLVIGEGNVVPIRGAG